MIAFFMKQKKAFLARCPTHGFTIMEVILVMGLLGVVAAVTIPSYRYYQQRNDLDRSADQVVQALHRAKLLSELGEQGSRWGFHTLEGTLFRGSTYAARDSNFDEEYPLPVSVTASGLPEVSFRILTGQPSATGSIVLTSINGEQRTITIQGGVRVIIVDEASDRLTVCHYPPGGGKPKTLHLPESAWPAHQGHGDTIGPCPGGK
jgi:prepilin-type N-terminal cleavage/methylation domain-containing protein